MPSHLLTADHTLSTTTPNNDLTYQNDELVLKNSYKLLHEVISQSKMWKMNDKLKGLKYLTSLSVVSIIQFCNNYNCYAIGVTKPNEIHYYINEDVKSALVGTSTAKQWCIFSTADLELLTTDDVLLLLQDYCTPISQKDFYNNPKSATAHLNMSSLSNIEEDNFNPFYRRYNLYAKSFRYAYNFLSDYIAKKHEIPYTHTKRNGAKALKNLFLDQLPSWFTYQLHDKSHKKLNRIKSLESLMRYTGKASHKLYKQFVHDKYKSYKAVILSANDGNVDRPEFVKKRVRNIQVAIQQSSLSEDDKNFSGKNEHEDGGEDIIMST
jgi:hypothetical protein